MFKSIDSKIDGFVPSVCLFLQAKKDHIGTLFLPVYNIIFIERLPPQTHLLDFFYRP